MNHLSHLKCLTNNVNYGSEVVSDYEGYHKVHINHDVNYNVSEITTTSETTEYNLLSTPWLTYNHQSDDGKIYSFNLILDMCASYLGVGTKNRNFLREIYPQVASFDEINEFSKWIKKLKDEGRLNSGIDTNKLVAVSECCC
jgi:hypothetical protein